MGFFKTFFGSEEEEESEDKLDLKDVLKGMNEKQLLKLLVIMYCDEHWESSFESLEDMIEAAKED